MVIAGAELHQMILWLLVESQLHLHFTCVPFQALTRDGQEKWFPKFNQFDFHWTRMEYDFAKQPNSSSNEWRSHHDELELFFSNLLNWEVKVVWDDWLICYSGGNFPTFCLQNFLCCATKSRERISCQLCNFRPKWNLAFWYQ